MISIILTIAIVGFLVCIITQINMPILFKNLIIGLVAIFLIIWTLQALGFATGFPLLHLGK